MKRVLKSEKGTIEVLVLGLLAALIIVLAMPVLSDLGSGTQRLPRHSSAAWVR